jgi:hypothetical protein
MKVGKKQRHFGEGLEEVMRLARRFDGEPDAPVDGEVVWGAAQTESEGALTDAVVKQYEAGLIPWAASLEKLGYTQTQIARYAAMRQRDALDRQMLDDPNAKISLNENT